MFAWLALGCASPSTYPTFHVTCQTKPSTLARAAPRIRHHATRDISSPRAPIAPRLHESLGERVTGPLRDLILSQVFPPGPKLNVEQICRDLGVSVHRLGRDATPGKRGPGQHGAPPRRLRVELRRRPDPRSLRGARRAEASRFARPRRISMTSARRPRGGGGGDGAGGRRGRDRAVVALGDRFPRPRAGHGAKPGAEPAPRERLRSDPGPAPAVPLPARTGRVERGRAPRDLRGGVAGDAERGERLARAHAEHVLQDALEFTRRRPERARWPRVSAQARTPWDRYAAALPTIAHAVGRTPLVRLNRVTTTGPPSTSSWSGTARAEASRIGSICTCSSRRRHGET